MLPVDLAISRFRRDLAVSRFLRVALLTARDFAFWAGRCLARMEMK